jgi:hypothetical protein
VLPNSTLPASSDSEQMLDRIQFTLSRAPANPVVMSYAQKFASGLSMIQPMALVFGGRGCLRSSAWHASIFEPYTDYDYGVPSHH